MHRLSTPVVHLCGGTYTYDPFHYKIYSRDGKLVAVTSQEGVVRASVRKPEDAKQSKTEVQSAKL